ncbi:MULTISPECIES: HNH endonuclease signature motif containing protein [Microbacterium]|uniref:HNH endonuclease n=1 Tax=Microbacterium TaxID=33882 RepID=UPI0013A5A72B|nr:MULTISPECIES: HNH endonuclease signature motif containing protein [Microbacterium]
MGKRADNDDAGRTALERVVADVQTTRSRIARLQAKEARLLTDAADIVRAREQARRDAGRKTPHDLPLREISAELGAAMRLSDRTVQARMSAASTLRESFAATLAQLREGRIDLAHASAIVDAGASIGDPTMREQYERIMLEAAGFETPPRLRAIARVVAARIDPDLAEELRSRAVGLRRIRLIDLEDGMARLLADLPAVLAHAIFDRLTRMAEKERDAERAVVVSDGEERESTALQVVGDAEPSRPAVPIEGEREGPSLIILEAGVAESSRPGERSAGDRQAPRLTTRPRSEERALDELRADIFADLVLTGAPTGHGDVLASIRAEVQITVPVLTAAGKSNEPALLAGYGPIDRATACELAAGAPGWDRVMFHPHSGLPMAVDRYRPTAALRRFLRARDQRCRFPGCPHRPKRADIDHTIDRAKGGATSDDNLAHICRRHHTVKHATAWRVRQLGGGVLEWISPTRRRYVDKPTSAVQFVPSSVFARLLAAPYDGAAPF